MSHGTSASGLVGDDVGGDGIGIVGDDTGGGGAGVGSEVNTPQPMSRILHSMPLKNSSQQASFVGWNIWSMLLGWSHESTIFLSFVHPSLVLRSTCQPYSVQSESVEGFPV